MSEPSRWNEDGADDFERSLLRSAKADRMSDAARDRIAAAVGTAAVVAAAAATPSASASASTAGLFSASKLVLVASALAIGAAAIGFSMRSRPVERVASPASSSAENAPGGERPTSLDVVGVVPTVRVEDLPAAAATSKRTSARSSAAVPNPVAGRADARTSLAAEAALLDGARALLQRVVILPPRARGSTRTSANSRQAHLRTKPA